MSRASLLLALALLAAPLPAGAQTIVDLALGTQHRGKAGSGIDFYRFGGESGATIKATLTAPGASALILYTPDGTEMLSAHGTGKVTLDAVLPLWSSYLIAVVRKSDSRPYVLDLNGQKPDDYASMFAHGAGYVFRSDKIGPYEVSTCWVEPGVRLRRSAPDWVEERSIGPGGKEVGTTKMKTGYSFAFERDVIFDGPNVIYRRTSPSPRDDRIAYLDVISTKILLRYNSYLCE